MPTINGVDYTDAQIAAFCAQDLDCPKFDADLVNLLAYLRDRSCHRSTETTIIRVPSVFSDARTQTEVFTETYTRKYANSCLHVIADISHYMEIENEPGSASDLDVKGESRVLIRFDGGIYSTVVQNRMNSLIAPTPINNDIFRASTSGNYPANICGTGSEVAIELAMLVESAGVGQPADETNYTEGSGLYGHSIVAPSSITIIETENI